MNINKFTEKAQEAVVAAQNLAGELTHAEITPEHLLRGPSRAVGRHRALDSAEDDDAIRRTSRVEARALLELAPKAYGGDVRLSPRMKLCSTRRRPRPSGCRTST